MRESKEDRHKKLQEIIQDNVDLKRISRFVIGKYWALTTEEKRQEFIKEHETYFTRLCIKILHNYIGGGEMMIMGVKEVGDGVYIGEKLLNLSQNLFMMRNVLGETQVSNEKYLDIFEERRQILTTKLPSRIGFSKDLLPKGWQLFLDGAHNNDGASVLSKWVANHFADGIYIIFGITRNKNVEGFLQHFKPYIKLLCAVCVKSEPHAINASVIKEKANNIGIKAVECESIGDAILNYILNPNNDGAKTILICGSLFLARDLAMELTEL
ncbi:Toluene tolerance Ttg2/phospholipid-binding protein MlaC,Mur ligase, C-terminal [Cinara cedri]|uniref:Toluene tolerance Ttg2/phospholipid-binding protein MlaC,Mur ligase, C-terminal n=1 Tax=Cinara cedri TaxID=506608 RepID=A0A5E4N950_9HEMI|nr:Toluene tolerance Ttg2/phospholipid-binding protein MlaC,Mur ligase, C-terminal [Cinara cedri]